MKDILLFILLIFVFYFISQVLKYKRELKKDKNLLSNKSIYELFPFLIDGLNDYCYKGNGHITRIDEKTINLYEEDSSQILTFLLNGGMLTVIWRFKYYHQEMTYEKSFPNARNATKEGQLAALDVIIQEFREKYDKHVAKIDASGIPDKIRNFYGISEDEIDEFRDIPGDY